MSGRNLRLGFYRPVGLIGSTLGLAIWFAIWFAMVSPPVGWTGCASDAADLVVCSIVKHQVDESESAVLLDDR